MKNDHHYVPKLYLRNFSSGRSRQDIINTFQIDDGRSKKDAGLKGLCSRWKFYGESDDVENMLSKHENEVAPVLARILDQGRLPEVGSGGMSLLYAFVALQMQRTTGDAMRTVGMLEKFKQNVEADFPGNRKTLPEIHDIKSQVKISLELWPVIYGCILDLGARLIVNRTAKPFITSDNPVAEYNQYCEDIKGYGTLGALCKGLQLFFPLSPSLAFIFYDRSVYKVGDLNRTVADTNSEKDVDLINLIQAMHAEALLLFSRWEQLAYVERIARRARPFRREDCTQLVESYDDGSRNSLVHGYTKIQNINLNLTFCSLRRNARRNTLIQRIGNRREINQFDNINNYFKRAFRNMHH